MFASSAIYPRDILPEKMEIENSLDVLYYNVAYINSSKLDIKFMHGHEIFQVFTDLF